MSYDCPLVLRTGKGIEIGRNNWKRCGGTGSNRESWSRTHLIVEESLLHTIIGANLLQDVPGELFVKLPGEEGHDDGYESNYDGDSDQKRVALVPDAARGLGSLEGIVVGQDLDGITNLIDLKGTVDEESKIRQVNPDDLDGVLHAQGIPD